ncbi:MAG: Zn-ribbon domain-containing OB-fold protein [Candidatus Contendobacter sp.]|nr:Zn-ribbon domain-containing OB-fold protein [Candidatus Contendobacter sp.]
MSELPFNSTSYYHLLSEHKLMGCRNKTSGKFYLPPRPMCTTSYSSDMEWEQVSGKGEIIAFTVITVAPTHMIEAGYSRENPYCAAIVRLQEGPAISAQILGVDLSMPEEAIKIGTPVQATFIERGEGPAKRIYLAFEVVQ